MTCERHCEMETSRVDGVDAAKDRRLPTPVRAHDHRERALKFNSLFSIWGESSNAADGELLDLGHGRVVGVRAARLCVQISSPSWLRPARRRRRPLRAAQLLGGFSQRCDTRPVNRVSSGGVRWGDPRARRIDC